jgi:GTP1/Obg family GTP-binding protein
MGDDRVANWQTGKALERKERETDEHLKDRTTDNQNMQQKEELESLLKTCESAKDSVDAFLRSINDYVAVVEELPAIVKPLVRRDLESNTGMSADEWKAFLERLGTRYSSIYDAAQRVTGALANGGDDTEVAEATATFNAMSAPLIEGADTAIEQLETMAVYMEGLPDKINMVPEAFLKGDSRAELISSVPGRVERARALKELLEKTKGELSAVAE